MPGKKKSRLGNRRHVYDALTKRGMNSTIAAKIANAGRTPAGRSRMARKAARTRSRRGR